MKNLIKSLLAFILAISISSCAGTVSIVKTARGAYQATSASEIEILKTKPDRAYEELGVVDAMNFPVNGVAKMHNALRAKAAPLGANAVFITDEGLLNNGWGIVRYSSGAAVRYK